MRHAGATRFRLSSPAARRYDSAGRKLLGELLERAKTDGVEVLTLQRTLQDGARIVARLAGSQHIVEITAPEDLASEGKLELKPQLVQGFVPKPSAVSDASNPEWIADPAWKGYPTGKYAVNSNGQVLFSNGLHNHTGNVDWRSTGEQFVISWGGVSDRYLGVYICGNFRGRKAWINGDVIVDLTSRTGLNGDDIVIGCCLTPDDQLVVAVGRERQNPSTPGRLRIYTAPLAPRDDPDLKWLTGVPLRRWPRFAPVDVDDWVLALDHEFDGDDWCGVCDGHPLCFNQSGTEGRMVVVYLANRFTFEPNVTVREYVVDISDLNNVTLSETTLETDPYVDTESSLTGLVVRLSAINANAGVYSDDPIPVPYEEQYWQGTDDAASAGCYVNEATYSEVVTPRVTWIPCAVDYRDDVPVYAYTRGWNTEKSGSWLAVPVTTFSPFTVGFYAEGTTTIDHSTEWTETWGGLKLPWNVGDAPLTIESELVGGGTTAGHTDGLAIVDYSVDPAGSGSDGIPNLSLGTTGTFEQNSTRRVLTIFCMDLRTNTVIYGIRETETITDESYAWSKSGTDGAPSRTVTTTRNNTVYTRLRIVVHVNGVDVEDSGMVLVSTFTQTGDISNSTSIGTGGGSNSEGWVKNGWLPTHAWDITSGAFTADGTFTAANADNTVMQDLIDGIPIAPLVGYPAGTYDLSGTYATASHPDKTAGGSLVPVIFGTMEDPSRISSIYDGPFRTLFGSFNPMDWGQVYPDGGSNPRRLPGSWGVDAAGNYCISMVWPGTNGAEGWLNTINSTETTLDALTGASGSTHFIPIWLTTEFLYEVKTKPASG